VSDNKSLHNRIDELEELIRVLEEKTTTQLKASKSNSKNRSNLHPEVKVSNRSIHMKGIVLTEFTKDLVHNMCWNMCNVDLAKNDRERVEALTVPLENGQPYEIIDGDIHVWRPDWGSPIDKSVNPRFVRELVDRILDDEKVYLASCLAENTN
jgi:hypothetical protein